MLRLRAVVVGGTLLALLAAAPAFAHQGNPNYRSVIHGVTPAEPGLKLQVLNFDDRLQLDNRTGKTVVVRGYQNEPYLRLLGDGTVQVNRNSPAYYLNNGRTSTGKVPANAKPGAAPSWQVVDRAGSYQWHDHRIHWMSAIPPKQDGQEQAHEGLRLEGAGAGRHPASVGHRHAVLAAEAGRRDPHGRARRAPRA